MEALRLKVGHHISLDSGSKHLLPTYVLKNSNFPSQNFCDKKVNYTNRCIRCRNLTPLAPAHSAIYKIIYLPVMYRILYRIFVPCYFFDQIAYICIMYYYLKIHKYWILTIGLKYMFLLWNSFVVFIAYIH